MKVIIFGLFTTKKKCRKSFTHLHWTKSEFTWNEWRFCLERHPRLSVVHSERITASVYE